MTSEELDYHHDWRAPAGVRALGYRHYRRFWIGGAVSNAGRHMQMAAVAWVVAVETRSALLVTLISFSTLIPLLLLAPVGGALADRFPRRTVLLVTQVLHVAQAVALLAVWQAGLATYPVLLGFSLAAGVIGALNAPAWQAVFSALVPVSSLQNAVMLNSTQFNVAKAVGPMLAGVLIATVGVAATFLGNALSSVGIVVALLLMPSVPPSSGAGDAGVIAKVRAGVAYARSEPGLLLVIATNGMMALVAAPIVHLMPVIALEVFAADSVGYGILAGSLGVGAVLGAVALGATDGRLPPSGNLSFALGLLLVTIAALGLAPNLAVGLAATVGFGACYLAVMATDNSAMQLLVDDRLRGRVASLWLMVFGALFPLGVVAQGALADAFGVRTVVVGDAVVLGAYFVLLRARGLLRHLDPPDDRWRVSTQRHA